MPPRKDGLRSYPLMQQEILLKGTGTQIRFALNQIDVAKVTSTRKRNGSRRVATEESRTVDSRIDCARRTG